MKGYKGNKLQFKYLLPPNCPTCLDTKYKKVEEPVIVYRLSQKKEFDLEEFKPQLYTSKPKHKRIQEKCKNEDGTWKEECCENAGLSVFLHKDDLSLQDVKDLINKYNLGKYIFKISYNKSIGILYETPGTFPSHCDLYIFNNVNEEEIAQFCCEQD